MEEHSLLIAEQVNKIFGPVVAPLKHALCSAVYGWFGKTYVPAEKIIPDHIVFAVIVFLFCCIFFPLVRRSFSMENERRTSGKKMQQKRKMITANTM